MLCVSMLAERFRGEPRVTFHSARRRTVDPDLRPHGADDPFRQDRHARRDWLRGPMLPIVRGTKKVFEQQASAGRRVDLIQGGHYPHHRNPGTCWRTARCPAIRSSATTCAPWSSRRNSGSTCFTRSGGCSASARRSSSKPRAWSRRRVSVSRRGWRHERGRRRPQER